MPELEFRTVSWLDSRAVALRDEFDAEMDERYGGGEPIEGRDDDAVAEIFATRDEEVASCLLGLVDGEPAAHGALFSRPEEGVLELRKVHVSPRFRRRGIARRLLAALEDRARELGGERILLDTGPRQPDAIALYEAVGYRRIPPFPPYDRLGAGDGDGGAICFEVPLGR